MSTRPKWLFPLSCGVAILGSLLFVASPALAGALYISPVPGLTTSWHPAPEATSVPLGTTLRFKRRVAPGGTIAWSGAQEVSNDGDWSVAECAVTTPGRMVVVADYVRQDGRRFLDQTVLDVESVRPDEIAFSALAAAAEPVELDPNDLNASSYEQFRKGSVAAVRKIGDDRYLTSTARRVELSVTVEPPGFAPLVEWSWRDRSPATRTRLGDRVEVSFLRPGSYPVWVGSGAALRRLFIDVYEVEITSHRSVQDELPEGVPVTFVAETNPPGFEDEITWLASTSYGTAEPFLGHGPTFTVRFDDTFGPGGPRSDSFQWLGVRADNAVFNQDQKADMDCFESTGRATVTLDVGDPECAFGIPLELSSQGREPSRVELDPPPYEDGVDIDTELVNLELGSSTLELGEVVVRERADKESIGRIENVEAENGRFVSGDSYFDVFVEVELPDAGLLFDSGDESLRLDAGTITQLPPLGDDYLPPPSGATVPLFVAGTTQQVGWLCHAQHTPREQVPCFGPPRKKCIYKLTCIEGDAADVAALGLAPGAQRWKSNCVNTCVAELTSRAAGAVGSVCMKWDLVECRVPLAGEAEIPGELTPCDCQPSTGACCQVGDCSLTTRVQCQNDDGIYQGDGTDCEDDPCPASAACSCAAALGPGFIEPGATQGVRCVIDNTSTQQCTFDWAVTKVGGTPTVNPMPAAGQVTLGPGQSLDLPLPVMVPAATAARDAAQLSLEVSGDAECRGMAPICVVPSGETSTFLQWRPPAGTDVAQFSGTLTPATADFSNREVTENPIGSGTNTMDTCWFDGSALPRYTNANSISGGTWPVNAGNVYSADNIGYATDLDAYYALNDRTPCMMSTVQHMKILCPTPFEYKQNTFQLNVTAAGTTISRDGAASTPH